MSKIVELKQERVKIHNEQQALLTKATEEARGLNADETAKFENMDTRFIEISKQIELEEKIKKRNLSAIDEEIKREHKTSGKDKADEYRDAFKDFMRKGANGMSAENRAVLEKRTQLTTTDSLGGYLVPEQWEGDIVKSLLAYGGMYEAANVRPSATGGKLPIPTVNDTSAKSVIIGQGVTDSKNNLTFGEVVLDSYTYTTQLVKLSYEQLQDMDVDLDLSGLLNERMFRGTNEHFTTGDGSGKPFGVVTRAGAGKTANAPTAVTVAELLDLQHSVDPSYRRMEGARWMFNDTTLAALRRLQVGTSDNRPLWQLSVREGEPDLLLGQKYIINQDMPDMEASAKPVLFGDFKKYRIRPVKGFEVKALYERYADERSVGFFGFYRADGNLLDTAAVKALTMAAS